MLRAMLTGIFTFLFVISIGLLVAGVPDFPFVLASGLVFAGMAFETWRYRRQLGPLTPDWVATDEVFEDPVSGKHMRVYFNAARGERRYEELATPILPSAPSTHIPRAG